MKLIRYLKAYQQEACVLTIGNFDGLHLGHQALFRQLARLKKKYQLPSVVMSFHPPPMIFFGHKQAQISNFKEWFKLMQQQDIDICLLLKFNQTFANLSSTDFIKTILINQLQVAHILIGDDFTFGKNRLGNKRVLKKYHSQFQVHQINQVCQAQQRISSSTIRTHLAKADFLNTRQLLGRAFSMTGRVIHGDKRGRTLGFPTLNMSIKRDISPIFGIFAVRIALADIWYNGVANIGNRPMVGGEKILLEVFVFNFNKMVYGQTATVEFCKKLRDEQKFSSFLVLKKQIQNDVKNAKKYFSQTKAQQA